MVEVKFYDRIDDKLLKFAVIITKANRRGGFCNPACLRIFCERENKSK